MTNIIDRLKAEGVLEMYLDFRSGSYLDLSGNDNTGAPTDITLSYNGADFDGSTSVVTVADDATLKGDEGCLVVVSDSLENVAQRFIQKADGGGEQFDLFIGTPGTLELNAVTLLTDISDKRVLAVNFSGTDDAEAYTDGNSAGSFSGTAVVADQTAPLLVGNDYGDGEQFKSTMQAALYISRQLTPSEQKELYEALLEPDFHEAVPFQEGDVDLFHALSGGQIAVDNGFIQMTGRLVVAMYLSWFGGNQDDPGGSDKTRSWWGNADEIDPNMQQRSELNYLLGFLPMVTSNLILLERAALRDVQWMFDLKVVSSIDLKINITALNRIRIFGSIEAKGEREDFDFTANWEASQ